MLKTRARCFVIALSLAAASCAGEVLPFAGADAGHPPDTRDADLEIDAGATSPVPDASAPRVDASSPGPDANTTEPDAATPPGDRTLAPPRNCSPLTPPVSARLWPVTTTWSPPPAPTRPNWC